MSGFCTLARTLYAQPRPQGTKRCAHDSAWCSFMSPRGNDCPHLLPQGISARGHCRFSCSSMCLAWDRRAINTTKKSEKWSPSRFYKPDARGRQGSDALYTLPGTFYCWIHLGTRYEVNRCGRYSCQKQPAEKRRRRSLSKRERWNVKKHNVILIVLVVLGKMCFLTKEDHGFESR